MRISPSTTAVLFNFTRFAWMVPLDRSADCQLLADDVAFHFCAFVYQNGQRPKFALDLAQYMYCGLATILPTTVMPRLTVQISLADFRSADFCCRQLRLLCGRKAV